MNISLKGVKVQKENKIVIYYYYKYYLSFYFY